MHLIMAAMGVGSQHPPEAFHTMEIVSLVLHGS